MESHEDVNKLKKQINDAHLIMVTALHLDDIPRAKQLLKLYFAKYDIKQTEKGG